MVEQAVHGHAVLDGTTLVYQPKAGFEGFDRFTVEESRSKNRWTWHVVVGRPFLSKTDVVYERLAELIFVLAVVAIFLEIALSTLFRNRMFQKFDGFPGIKTLVSIGVSVLIVWTFDFDVFGEVLAAVGTGYAAADGRQYVSMFITALLLAGGSSTVFFIYTKLGIRNPFRTGAAQGVSGTGLLKVTVTRGASVPATEIVSVMLDDALLGTIPENQTVFGGDKGYQVAAGLYVVKVVANGPLGTRQEASRTVAIQPGQPVDLQLGFG